MRQTIQRQHAKHCGQPGEQNRHFERHDDERRPGVEGLAADIHRIRHGCNPILERVTRQSAHNAPDQNHLAARHSS